ncbi:uncharacterized protein [Cherax quadricarinatus]|uniref:uncharacterized protein isoform X2 n=1 Tax=Cherax quadricarinatus TaxID=27406 RepID=UPI002379C46C|nr:uncharacterized protein LOC128695358 [Cherax quadricarinatus]
MIIGLKYYPKLMWITPLIKCVTGALAPLSRGMTSSASDDGGASSRSSPKKAKTPIDMKKKLSQLLITMFFSRKPATTPANSDSSDVDDPLSIIGSDAGSEELESTH